MEFRDNLKRLRTERGLTQAQLAEQIFVSRSTVAKWENGLGLPSEESMAAIEALFGVSLRELKTSEPETVIVQKNQRLRQRRRVIVCTVAVSLILLVGSLLFAAQIAVKSGYVGLSPEAVIGNYVKNETVDTGDYLIYFFCHKGSFSDGRQFRFMRDYRIVKRHAFFYTPAMNDVCEQVIKRGEEIAGTLLTVEGKNGYYHLIRPKWLGADTPSADLICTDTVTVDGAPHTLQGNVFFVTKEPLTYFEINGVRYDVTASEGAAQ